MLINKNGTEQNYVVLIRLFIYLLYYYLFIKTLFVIIIIVSWILFISCVVVIRNIYVLLIVGYASLLNISILHLNTATTSNIRSGDAEV